MTSEEYKIDVTRDGATAVVEGKRYPFCDIPGAIKAVVNHSKETFQHTFRFYGAGEEQNG